MTANEFFVEFPTRLDKIHKLERNEKLKGQILLKKLNLGAHDRNIMFVPTYGECSLQDLSNSLKNAYRREGLPPSLMNTKTSMKPHNY